MVRPMVHSKKHYVQTSLETVTAGVPNHNVLVSALENPTSVEEITEGSTVKAIFIEYWIRSASLTPASGQAIIYKESSDTTTPTATEMAALGDWDNKKNIFYTTMGLFNDADADAINIYKGWLKIPRGKQRFGLGDTLRISVFSPSIDLHLCGFATFKEYN